MNKSGLIIFGKRNYLYQRIFRRTCQSQRNELTATPHFPKPVIPIRIKRGPTDILNALASTVSRDPTAFDYKFHDDPYLYPFSSISKKLNALSEESGRKAAKWIRDKHPDLFKHHPDDPVITKFIPKITFNEESDVSESDLMYCINNVHVKEAINVYTLCQSKNVELSDDVRQSLLELVSFYNCDDALDVEWLEEKKNEQRETFDKVNTWKDGEFAEELFNKLKGKGERPYCAIIRGMCKHGQRQKAMQLYQEALENNYVLDTDTLNCIISIMPSLERDYKLAWDSILEILHKMIEFKLPPNLGTLNAILDALKYIRGWKPAKNVSLQILKEFNELNVEPSLATYFYLIKIAYYPKETAETAGSGFLNSTLDVIENKSFDVRDMNDSKFFRAAMETCFYDVKCFQTATRVHNVLMCGNNFKFLGLLLDENTYLRYYFIMAMNSLPLKEFMELYDNWVPQFYSPSGEVMIEVINTISFYGDLKLLPRIWSDCILLENYQNEELLVLILDVIAKQNLEEVDEELAKQLVNIVWFIREIPKEQALQKNRKWNLVLTGAMVSDCLSVLVRCKDMEKAQIVVNDFLERPTELIGVVSLRALKFFFDSAAENGLYKEMMMTLRYCQENYNNEAVKWANDLYNKTSTPEDIKSRLEYYISK